MRGSRLAVRQRVMDILVEVARRHELISYSELGRRLGLPTRGPHWKAILDDISLNRGEGVPDITFLVISRATGLPAQIDFRRSSGRETEAVRAVAEQEAVWHHCGPRP
jgi:hypothetical protein